MGTAEHKTVLITGATDGIGLELARLYNRKGCRLVLTGRKPLSSLNDPLFKTTTYCQADFTQKNYCETLLQFLATQAIEHLDLCIQNAATSYYGAIHNQSSASIQELVDVNLKAPIHLTRSLLPYLQMAYRGKLVFISSIASHMPCPLYAVYGATKTALNGFARSLRVELDNQLDVQVIHPGAIATKFHEKAGITERDLPISTFPAPKKVAHKIRRRVDSPQREAVIGTRNTLFSWTGRRFRGPIEAAMRRKLP